MEDPRAPRRPGSGSSGSIDPSSSDANPGRSLLSRRGLLAIGGAAAAAVAVGCTPEDPLAERPPSPAEVPAPPTAAAAPTAGATTAAAPSTRPAVLTTERFDALPVCRLTPAGLEGPFPNREELVRSDIREGRPGHPVTLGLRVVDGGCAPLAGAAVSVWHTDHTGDYSSYADGGSGKDEGEGTTFLRGVQTSDADGIVHFDTIFPGWYDGRAVHVHVAVRTAEGAELVTQLYFAESVTRAVLSEGVYAELGPPDTTLADDGLAGDPAAEGTQLVVEPLEARGSDGEAGSLALLNLGLA